MISEIMCSLELAECLAPMFGEEGGSSPRAEQHAAFSYFFQCLKQFFVLLPKKIALDYNFGNFYFPLFPFAEIKINLPRPRRPACPGNNSRWLVRLHGRTFASRARAIGNHLVRSSRS